MTQWTNGSSSTAEIIPGSHTHKSFDYTTNSSNLARLSNLQRLHLHWLTLWTTKCFTSIKALSVCPPIRFITQHASYIGKTEFNNFTLAAYPLESLPQTTDRPLTAEGIRPPHDIRSPPFGLPQHVIVRPFIQQLNDFAATFTHVTSISLTH